MIQFLGCTTIATSFLVAMAIVSLGGGWVPILAGCLTVAATQIGSFLPSLAQREGRLRVAFNAYRLTPQIVGLMAAGCCWIFLERDAAMWLLVISASQFVAVSILFVIEFMRDRVYSRSLRDLWRESWRIAPASWSSLLQYRVDMLVVAAVLPPSQIAFYAIGVAVQNAVFSVGQSTGMKMFSDRARGRTLLTRRLLQATGARLLVLALGCSVAAWFMVPVVYGPDYTQARTVAAILALSGAAQSMDYLIWHQLIGNVPSRILLLIRVPSIAMLVTFVVITSLQPDAAILAAGGTLVSNWLAVAFMMCVSLNRKKMKVDD
jgi:O-antigen/teichoic acid export membrane protein